ncbi:hypothetical protein [Agreia bicolorata]|uniref:Uncharacterized protein n=1 Tax=Agreia bicolorata TaxID=110935 RepID=A0ABR5CE35_9MICO|nr:hypothetical protein [Agreia bicolorata]KJC63889.1 hypothetical protein TZ00_12825 [Agreia bicolorata]
MCERNLAGYGQFVGLDEADRCPVAIQLDMDSDFSVKLQRGCVVEFCRSQLRIRFCTQQSHDLSCCLCRDHAGDVVERVVEEDHIVQVERQSKNIGCVSGAEHHVRLGGVTD